MELDPTDSVVRRARQRYSRRHVLAAPAALLAAERLARAEQRERTVEHAVPSLRAQRLTWAGVRLELPSAVLFIDPLISGSVWGATLADPLIPLAGGPPTRFVLLTHLHPDHFDTAAVKQVVDAGGTLFCDARVAADVASRGFRTRGINAFEPALLGDFTVTPVPAVDGYGDPQVSWVVDGGRRRVIHCGDTLWHGNWWRIGRQLGPFDAAFLPINGARFRWRQPAAEVASVMAPEQAVAAAVVLGAKRIVPIHYGVSGAEGYQEDDRVEARTVEIGKQRGVGVDVVKPGDWLQWGEADK